MSFILDMDSEKYKIFKDFQFLRAILLALYESPFELTFKVQ